MYRIANKKLGKKPAVVDNRVAHFSMIRNRLIVPPLSANWYAAVGDWTMLANDNVGDCVQAAALHALKQFSTYAGQPLVPTDADAIDFYSKSQGYVPGQPSTDNGSYVFGTTGAIPYWHTTGIMCGGKLNKLDAFLQIASGNPEEVKQAIFTFGGCMVGMNLPEYIVKPAETPYLWDVTTGPVSIAGGHEVWVDGYMSIAGEEMYEFVSWGERFRMTRAFMLKYVDEIAVMYSRVSLNTKGVDARGLPEPLLLALMSGLQHLA